MRCCVICTSLVTGVPFVVTVWTSTTPCAAHAVEESIVTAYAAIAAIQRVIVPISLRPGRNLCRSAACQGVFQESHTGAYGVRRSGLRAGADGR